MLTVGFSTRNITPSIGAFIPGLFERRKATGVADDLLARAAVLDDGAQTIAIVQVDTIALPNSVVLDARRHIQRETGIAPSSCLLAATHTHSGGPVADLFSTPCDLAYLKHLGERIAEAVIEAHANRRKCVVGTSVSHAPGVAFNRRFVMKDGTQVTHPGKMNPAIDYVAGPADDTVTVIGFADPKSRRPFGCIVQFACHATHMNGFEFSADYPHWIAQTLQGAYGEEFGVVFLNGPCGDITQVDNQSSRPLECGPYWCERTGRAVGGAALHALAIADYFSSASIDTATVGVSAAIRQASTKDLEKAKQRLKGVATDCEDVDVSYAREMLAVDALRRKCATASLEIQGVRIADTFLWTAPGEVFQAFATDVRARSPFTKTIGVELANGYFGYICTPEAYSGGGYEVRLARSSMLEETAGHTIADAASRLAELMHGRARKELSRLSKKRTWPTVVDTALDALNELERRRRTK
ncbi:MAG: hypothetical protein K1Y02_06475 [Candidatus Hydrogenedentes bacterium]|nr:hypothetical protein [Candidatus Hydrogenedentota bacterium]